MTATQETLFALDCGATNWRLYRANYSLQNNIPTLVGEPQVSPLTSFVDRKLPSVLFLNPEGDKLESMGDFAQQQLEDENNRDRVREYFKPCIGAHLLDNPLPHQKRYTHTEALKYTTLLLETVVEQIKAEKWRASSFDDRVWFTFAFPVHWRMEFEEKIFLDFKINVLSCFPTEFHSQIRFVAEPEGAILQFKHQGLFDKKDGSKTVMITDVGGSTTDIVIGQVDPRSNDLEYIGRYGEPFGGGHYDTEIAKYIAETLALPAATLAEHPAVMTTLRMFGQRLKESLSRQMLQPGNMSQVPQRSISLILPNSDIFRRVIPLSEEIFNETTGHLQDGFETLIENALTKINIKENEVDQVLLVGGGAKLFSIVRHLRERFGDEKVILADNPDEIVVQGIGLEYGQSFQNYQPTMIFSLDIPLKPEPKEEPAPQKKRAWRLISENILFPLESETEYKVGRDKSNEIHINKEKLSRFHALIKVSSDQMEITDLKSTNGTFLNDAKLTPDVPQPFKPGDILRFGDVEFLCEEIKTKSE